MLVLFLAWFLQDKLHSIRDWRNTLLPAALPTLVFILLIVKEPDLGTALVCAAVAALMFYLAGAETKYFGYAVLAAAPVLYFLLFRVPWRRARMLAFLNPEADPQGSGFHTIQSLIAVGTGGIRGLGFMEGRQKLFYLPAAAHRLHLCQYRRGARPDWRVGHHRPVRRPRLSRAAGGQPFQRRLRALSRFRHHGDHPDPGLLQYQRGARAGADQRHHAAVRLLRRHVSVHHPGEHWRAAEPHPGDRLTGMRVMIAGGGTGGHVIPALAIAGALKSAYAAEVCFVGTARGMETRLVPQAGYALELIDVGQLNRVSLATQLKTLVALPRGILYCMRLLRRWQPQVVVGVGGYASGPAMLAALVQRVPTLAFEPNAVPGLANRLIGKRIRAAAVNFAPTLAYFRNAEVTGIPGARRVLRAPSPAAGKSAPAARDGRKPGRPRAEPDECRRLPRRCWMPFPASPSCTRPEPATPRLPKPPMRPVERPQTAGRCRPFSRTCPTQFAASDLILARSGASTVAELAASGKPSLLVPFPQAADDHQRKNAEVLVEGGAAEMLLEQEMTGARLLDALIRPA